MLPVRIAEQIPDVPAEQRTYDELANRVRKLRWMGFEEEANRAQQILQKSRPTRQPTVGQFRCQHKKT